MIHGNAILLDSDHHQWQNNTSWDIAFLRRFCHIAFEFHVFRFRNILLFYAEQDHQLCVQPYLRTSETGWPSYTHRHPDPFCRLLRLAELRWRYCNSPPCGEWYFPYARCNNCARVIQFLTYQAGLNASTSDLQSKATWFESRPSRGFQRISSVPSCKLRDSALKQATISSFRILIHNCHSVMRRYIVTVSDVINKSKSKYCVYSGWYLRNYIVFYFAWAVLREERFGLLKVCVTCGRMYLFSYLCTTCPNTCDPLTHLCAQRALVPSQLPVMPLVWNSNQECHNSLLVSSVA
jgi:hypothetical protein